MNKQITRVWTFASDSNPNIEYETLQYQDRLRSICIAVFICEHQPLVCF
jgi:hypothetical protein